MEEEYRLHKTNVSVDMNGEAGDGASVAGLKRTSSEGVNTPSDIPTIRISSESMRTPNAAPGTGFSEKPGTRKPALEKPETAQANEGPNSPLGMKSEGEQPVSAFSHKRLCERWLDNLFLVLYEDLRVYTIWRAEISHFKTQHMSYRKTGTEWEILGELASRLHHKEEAKEAYQRCLESKFSAKALMKLLETYANEGDLQKTLTAAVRLTTYHHRWYMDASYPSMVAHYLYKVGLIHGHAKIQYTMLSMNLPVGIFEIMQGYMKYGATFNVSLLWDENVSSHC